MTDPRTQSDADQRPWEDAGAVRRDVEPHRGNVLLLLASVALVLGVLALLVVVTGWVAVPLGAVVHRMAGRDLRRMRDGSLDPAGWAQARRARWLAEAGTVSGAFGGGGCTLLLVLATALLMSLAR